jgi:hypothetical protein
MALSTPVRLDPGDGSCHREAVLLRFMTQCQWHGCLNQSSRPVKSPDGALTGRRGDDEPLPCLALGLSPGLSLGIAESGLVVERTGLAALMAASSRAMMRSEPPTSSSTRATATITESTIASGSCSTQPRFGMRRVESHGGARHGPKASIECDRPRRHCALIDGQKKVRAQGERRSPRAANSRSTLARRTSTWRRSVSRRSGAPNEASLPVT